MFFRKTYTTEMLGESTERHLSTLRQRYGEKRLREAAVRRAHLNYQRIHIGGNPGSGRVKFLLAQMHQTYYFGFAESACILSGTLLEQGLIYRLGVLLDRKGAVQFARQGEKRWLQTRHDLLELELVDMLDLARAEGIITDGRTLLLAHEIRWIRNMVVHEKIPVFRVRDEKYLEMTVTKSRRGRVRYARILARKGGGSGPDDRQTQSVCRRAHSLFLREPHADDTATVVNQPDTEAKKGDESGGSLFLWTES